MNHKPECYLRCRGVTLTEFLVVLGIVVLLALIYSCVVDSDDGKKAKASLAISGAQMAIKDTGTKVTGASVPVPDCEKKDELARNIADAQKKINEAASDYADDYAANKSAIEREIDKVNQGIRTYNVSCSTSVPEITLPP